MAVLSDQPILTEGFVELLRPVTTNVEGCNLSHKEVRGLARSLLVIIPLLQLPASLRGKILVLIECIAASGLAHYDRSSCAKLIIKMIEDWAFAESLEKREAWKDLDF